MKSASRVCVSPSVIRCVGNSSPLPLHCWPIDGLLDRKSPSESGIARARPGWLKIDGGGSPHVVGKNTNAAPSILNKSLRSWVSLRHASPNCQRAPPLTALYNNKILDFSRDPSVYDTRIGMHFLCLHGIGTNSQVKSFHSN